MIEKSEKRVTVPLKIYFNLEGLTFNENGPHEYIPVGTLNIILKDRAGRLYSNLRNFRGLPADYKRLEEIAADLRIEGRMQGYSDFKLCYIKFDDQRNKSTSLKIRLRDIFKFENKTKKDPKYYAGP